MTDSGIPPLLVWMNMPSHHQSAFFKALREAGCDLLVCYYGVLSEERRRLGWEEVQSLPQGEMFFDLRQTQLSSIPDLRNRVHIVPGYGERCLRQLVVTLSHEKIRWMHWSEPARPGLRWWASYPIKRWYARMVNRYASAALAIGEMARKDFLRWGIRGEKIALLPYAVSGLCSNEECDNVVSEFGKRFKVLFVYVGALNHRKGIDVLLKAFAQIARINPSIGLALIGKDSSRVNYCKMAEREGINEKVLFRGPVQASSIASVIEAGGVMILPSRFDGWGMALNEAASLSRALIGTNRCGSSHHLIRHGENGFIVPSGNIFKLAEAIKCYAEDAELVHLHGNKSREIFAAFSPEANVQRLLVLFRTNA